MFKLALFFFSFLSVLVSFLRFPCVSVIRCAILESLLEGHNAETKIAIRDRYEGVIKLFRVGVGGVLISGQIKYWAFFIENGRMNRRWCGLPCLKSEGEIDSL